MSIGAFNLIEHSFVDGSMQYVLMVATFAFLLIAVCPKDSVSKVRITTADIAFGALIAWSIIDNHRPIELSSLFLRLACLGIWVYARLLDKRIVKKFLIGAVTIAALIQSVIAGLQWIGWTEAYMPICL